MSRAYAGLVSNWVAIRSGVTLIKTCPFGSPGWAFFSFGTSEATEVGEPWGFEVQHNMCRVTC